MVDQGSQLGATPAATRREVEESRAEVRAAQHGVRDDAREHRRCDSHLETHDDESTVSGAYGLGRSVSPLRQRRAMDLSTMTAAAVIPA